MKTKSRINFVIFTNLAGDVGGKEFILDIEVMLNDDTLLNLEMQVANEHNWPERSLSYLCRTFDQLYSGQEYTNALPVMYLFFELNIINIKKHKAILTEK